MYVIMVYDVSEERVARVLKVARKYLTWVQNSVLEGELTYSKFFQLKEELEEIIEKEEDSIIFFKLRTPRYLEREILGIEKGRGRSPIL